MRIPPRIQSRNQVKTLLTIALILFACSTQAEATFDSYNQWKGRCEELSKSFKEKLSHAPYHPFADPDSRRCSDPKGDYSWEASPTNLNILLANFFYHHDVRVRQKALEMLEHYSCDPEKDCGEMARILDEHINATLDQQLLEWRSKFVTRARKLQRKVLNRAASAK